MFVMDDSIVSTANGGSMKVKDSVPLAPLQRYAWFNLIVFAIAVTLYLMAVPFFEWRFHITLTRAALPSLGVFGVCGLWGLGNYFLKDHQRRARVNPDEREALIYRRAGMIGVVLFWEVFVVLCMGVWAYLYVRHQATVPIGFLPFLVLAGSVVLWVTQSIAILMQYRRSAADDAF